MAIDMRGKNHNEESLRKNSAVRRKFPKFVMGENACDKNFHLVLQETAKIAGKVKKKNGLQKSKKEIKFYRKNYINEICACYESGACIVLSYNQKKWQGYSVKIGAGKYSRVITEDEAKRFYKDITPDVSLLDELDAKITADRVVQDLRAEYLVSSGLSEIVFDNGNRWFGGDVNPDNLIFDAGEPTGCGVMLYPDGTVYMGKLRGGSYDSPGILYNKDGARNFESEDAHGSEYKGTKYYKDGTRITGNFWYDTPHCGYGCKEYRLDDKGNEYLAYEGGFEEGKRQYKGVEYMLDGTKYEGSFFAGERHGMGYIYDNDGKSELVQYIMGKIKGEESRVQNGKTAFYLEDWSKYEGEISDGKRHGKGVLYSKYGVKVYEGEWKNDKMHGRGIAYNDKDPEDSERSFRNQTIVGAVYYEGEFRNGKMNGIGKLYFSNTGELCYHGEFKNDKRHGKGTEYSHSLSPGGGYDSETTGEWIKDEKHGEFLETQKRGKKQILTYDNGNFLGGKDTPDSKVDYTQIIKELEERAEQGDTEAMQDLGSLYGGGFLEKTDKKKYVEWHIKAVEYGDYSAKSSIINLSLSNMTEKAIEEFLTAAFEFIKSEDKKESSLRCKFRLAICYENGFGTKVDYQKAIELYEKSALQLGQKASAEYLLARMYREGKGFTQKVDKWEKWWSYAEHDYKRGKKLEEEGKSEEAVAAYKKASNKGLEDANAALKKHGIECGYKNPALWCANRVEI